MKRITIKGGQPYSKPRFNLVAFNPKQVEITFRLDDASTYFSDEDDWYKLGGLSFSLVPNKHACMWGIRQVKGQWWITPYINLSYTKAHDFNRLHIEKNQTYTATIAKVDERIMYEVFNHSGELIFQQLVYFPKWFGFISFVRQFYAGGDSFPLNTFSLNYQIRII